MRPRGFIESWAPIARTRVLLTQIDKVLDTYKAQLPLTIRQIFYRLVATYAYEKTETAYKKLIELFNTARRAGRIPWSAIRDDGFIAEEPFFYDSVEHFFGVVRAQAEQLRLDRQAGQPRRLALWCEAGGMVPQLARVGAPYTIPAYSSGGFDSTTKKHDLALEWARLGQPVTLLHVGDQDPSGVHNMQALAEDLIAFGIGLDIEIVRLAILPSQAVDLPPAPPKEKDKRRFDRMLIRARTGFEHEFAAIDPTQTWQAEALDPAILAAIIEAAIQDRIDDGIYRDQLALEAETRQDVISRLGLGE